ncbi:MAG: YHS domain-containing (seleno)protein [Thermodesulfobacteriota bacterium]
MRAYFAVFAIFALWLLAATPATAVEPVNETWRGIAIEGYDPVAYFTEGRAVEGSSEHTFEWMGATWRFASAANHDRFAADPAAYAPSYGGYCAWAVSQGKTAGVDPEAWKIVGGRLFLNYSKDVQRMWEQDVDGNVRKADANWPKLVGAEP